MSENKKYIYEVKMKISGKDIYERLTPAEKERFSDVVISNVEKCDDTVIITGIAVENKDLNVSEYGMYENGEPVLRHYN